MVGLGFGWNRNVFRPGFGSRLPGRSDGFGSRLMLGPEAFALLHGGEVQIAIVVAEPESTIEPVLQDDTILGPDPLSLLFGDLIPDVLVADREVVGHAALLGSGEQLLEVYVVG